RIIVTDEHKARLSMEKNAKAVVKYLDPDYPMVRKDREYDTVIRMLDRQWVAVNGPAWLKRYEKASSWLQTLKAFRRKFFQNRNKRIA
ncbi:MAG TPA: hypothetical protein VD736_03685, partial [Nitrososphaera sp.]|nr:hypothetical protein [Nitrososphaera sp.]